MKIPTPSIYSWCHFKLPYFAFIMPFLFIRLTASKHKIELQFITDILSAIEQYELLIQENCKLGNIRYYNLIYVQRVKQGTSIQTISLFWPMILSFPSIQERHTSKAKSSKSFCIEH